MARSDRILVATCLAVALAAPAGTSAAPPSGTLAANAADGHIAAYGDVVAWNVYDGPTRFRLVVRHNGTTATLPVAAANRPFDVSAGRGPNGATWLVWTRCSDDAAEQGIRAARSCDVVRYDLAHPGEVKVAGAATAAYNEFAPSIDGDRVAFGRVTRGSGVEQVALTATGATARAKPVPGGIPASTCRLAMLLTCAPTFTPIVTGTALRGDSLAVGSRVQVRDAVGICGLAEARLLSLRTGFATQLAEAVCGLSGQSYRPFGFDRTGALWLARVCNGDTGGCKGPRGDPLRWDPRTRTSTRRPVPRGRGIVGLAVAGDTLVTAVRSASTARCAAGSSDFFEECVRVAAPMSVAAVSSPLYVSGTVPPDGYLATTGLGRRQVVEPPARQACQTTGPAPAVGAELWAGVQMPGSAIRVTATSGSRRVRGTVKAGRPSDVWGYVPLKLGGRSACGRTWRLTYRAGSRARTFRTTFAKG